jgi:hypothetical protein
MLLWLQLVQAVLYIALLMLAGQGVLHLLAGPRRDHNPVYRLFCWANRPWVDLGARISPRQVAPRHHAVVAFCVLGALYLWVTLSKIQHCLAAGMVGCR